MGAVGISLVALCGGGMDVGCRAGSAVKNQKVVETQGNFGVVAFFVC
jgi:hypothetical protein